MLGYILRRLLNTVVMVLIASTAGYFLASTALFPRGTYEAIQSALAHIPNDDLDGTSWITMGAAIKAALAQRSGDLERSAAAQEIQGRLKLLSEREREVLAGLIAGKPNKIIAYDLGISARTVEIYRSNVMAKMQADSLSALVRMGILAGLGA